MKNTPTIFQAVNARNEISSKWIARETGKLHKNVIRDIELLQNEDGSNLGHRTDSRVYVAEYHMPLSFAVMLLDATEHFFYPEEVLQ